MVVGVKGRRRFPGIEIRGVKNFKWVSRVGKELGMGKVGLGSNKLAAQQPISKSCYGPSTI